MKKLLLLTLITTTFNCYSQHSEINDEQKIKVVVNQFFEALEKKDTMLLKNTTMANAQFWRIYSDESPRRANMRFINEDVLNLKSLPPVKEIALDFEIEVHNDIAMAWVPYKFLINNEFSHCGIDIFNFFRIDGSWKIISAAYSIERENCDRLNVDKE